MSSLSAWLVATELHTLEPLERVKSTSESLRLFPVGKECNQGEDKADHHHDARLNRRNLQGVRLRPVLAQMCLTGALVMSCSALDQTSSTLDQTAIVECVCGFK